MSGHPESVRPAASEMDRQLAGLSRAELAAAAVSLVWVVAIIGYAWLNRRAEGSSLIETLALVISPIFLVGAALVVLRAIRTLQAEATALRVAVDAMRGAHDAARDEIRDEARSTPSSAAAPSQVPPHEKADPGKRHDAQPASFQSRRDASLTVPSADRKATLAAPQPELEEPGLALGTPNEPQDPQLAVVDLITALQFPENAQDREGFRALRVVLEDRRLAKLIRAAQDVLTLLSQEGIYMDDLKPEMARTDLWRRFAAGERGRSVAAIGGIRDRASLALTARRMREDTVFRDAAHHFLRTFDHTFAFVEPEATDTEIAALADTRTARAFMLFGRVTGTFD